MLANFCFQLLYLAPCEPYAPFLIHQFFSYLVSALTTPMVPYWLMTLSDWHFFLLATSFHLVLWSMEGKARLWLKLQQCLLWSTIMDCIQYGVVLAPVSVAHRLLGIFLLLSGLMPFEQLCRPVVRDVRFWFDSDFDLDISYLWSPHKYRRRQQSTRMPKSYHLQLRVQCRVIWIPVRDPVPNFKQPSTWKFWLLSRQTPTDKLITTKQREETYVSAKSLASSCLESAGEVNAPDSATSLNQMLARCATDSVFCQAMCHELEFPNLSSMCFYFKYGIPSTFHQLHAASSDINPGHIDLLLKKTNPLKLYNLEQTVTDETLFRSKRETAHHYKVTALYNSIDVGEDVCFQLNKRFTRGSQAVAYHNCREGSKLTPIVFDTGCSVSITPIARTSLVNSRSPCAPPSRVLARKLTIGLKVLALLSGQYMMQMALSSRSELMPTMYHLLTFASSVPRHLFKSNPWMMTSRVLRSAVPK
jgi:hypothetical protein